MCGIFGVYSCTGLDNARDFNKAVSTLRHRGPDDQGQFRDEHVFLGHTRLSIIDLSPLGHQPMSNEDGLVWIVYNGEIYNSLELKKDLELKGHVIKSKCDTETIIHLYEEYGPDCVHYLRGMFSFVIWDKGHCRLFGARDRLGIKPLYYSLPRSDLFLFASEIKTLLASGLISKAIDTEAIYHYLTFGAIPGPSTILKDVCTLLPGHRFMFHNGHLDVDRYWDVKFHTQTLVKDEREWIEGLRQHLEEAIRIRLRSDVPLGIFLSGGIDSSAIVGLTSQMISGPVKTFSIGYDVGGSVYNETHYAKTVAQRFCTDHTETIICGEDIANALDNIIWYMDQPTHNALNSYFISLVARTSVTVALSGLGGDELFAGYSTFRYAQKLADIGLTANIPITIGDKVRKLSSLFPSRYQTTSLWRNAMGVLGAFPTIADQYAAVKCYFSENEKQKLISSSFRSALPISCSTSVCLLKSLLSHVEGANIVDQIQYLELKSYMPDTLLRDIDAMSMAHSLEVRVPLIDHKLVEYAASIPSILKLNGVQTKYVFIEAIKDLLPNETLKRKKMGFGFPMGIWMQYGKLRNVIDDCFTQQSVNKRGLFQYESVQKVYKDFYRNEGSPIENYWVYQRVWLLTILELWCRKYLDE